MLKQSADHARAMLRKHMREQRAELGAPQRMAAAQGLRRSLEQLPEFMRASRIAGYWASGGEIPLNLAVARLTDRDQQLYLPRILALRQMRFAPWSAGDAIVPNRYGIPEPMPEQDDVAPERMDLVLVPLLAFARNGSRLGSGGGYYDRSFAFLQEKTRPTTPLLVGVSYAFQEQSSLTMHAWDIMLDFVATEHELIDCHAIGN